MSHPAELLKRYLTELNERIVKSDAKSDGGIQTVSETVIKLDVKLDGNIQRTNDAIDRLDSKLDSGAQMTNEAVTKLDSKLNGDVKTMTETISKLGDKLDASVQTTNQAIGDLYREKLSVREFQEFVNAFYEILAEGLPLPKEPVLETKSDAPQNAEAISSSQTAAEVTPQIIIENNPSKVEEKAPLAAEAPVGDPINKHVGFPMKVVGESYYVGNGVTSIVGDVEIPPGTTVDETLVVKGNFRSRECCILLNDVKALKDIEIGNDTTVEGNLVSGGKVTVHPDCVVKGSIESEGDIEIGENVIVIAENISSNSSVILSESAQVYRPIKAAKGVLRP